MADLTEVQSPLDESKFVTFPDSPFRLYQPFEPAGDPGGEFGDAGIARGEIAARGIVRARGLLQQIKPDLVVGFGGYPTVPPLMTTVAAEPPETIVKLAAAAQL